MRWTEENKEILWNTIFKTQSFYIDLDVVSATWPGDEKPTPKALKEHLSKYRKSLGGENKITFGMSAKRSPDDGVPVGKSRKRTGGGTGAGTGAGVQKNKAAPKGKGAAAAKGKSANAKGKGKVATKGEVQEEEHDSDVDMDEEEQEEGIKAQFKEERDLFSGVSAEVESQETLDMPFIKRDPGMDDDFC
ncbi:hypothetical protein BJX66DRAFT_336143 [Aspergillus keveii]|uniref:Uncharacterized protein n=1 Tax=Aspergillus keveii TaxID=714993 RepID=A0ABR4GBI4_9EURO